MIHPRQTIAAALIAIAGIAPARADDVIDTRLMSLELAADIATAAVAACREMGYQVSAVVVDRGGIDQVVMRDVHASRFTTEIARRKANAVVLSAVSTAEFLRNRPEIIASMNQLDEVLVLQGSLPIRAAGALLGAVGVSGALGGDKDEACAAKALESVAERLAFVD